MSGPLLARGPTDLDAARLTTILRNQGALARNGRVSSVSHAAIGNGLMSDSYRFKLEYCGNAGNAPRSIVGKFAAADPTSRSTAARLQLYRTELHFYRELAGTIDARTPRMYFADIDLETHEFTLLLEDQFPARSIDQLQGCSREDAVSALRELAKLHGPRWNDPGLAKIDWLQERAIVIREIAESALPQAQNVVSERFSSQLESSDLCLIERFVQIWPGVLCDTRSPRTLVHTDYRPDNLLFDVQGEAGSVVVLDWAGILHGSGLLDVGYFIGSALSADQRECHERELVRIYHTELSRYSIGGYDFEACWLDYRRFPFFGLFTSLLAPLMVERTERSDALFAQMIRQCCRQIATLGSLALWD